MTAAFTMGGSISSSNSNYAAMARATTFSRATPETVEVCGFKDCKRAGGGPRLEKLVNSVLEEKGLVDAVKVEGCDCQVRFVLLHMLYYSSWLLLKFQNGT